MRPDALVYASLWMLFVLLACDAPEPPPPSAEAIDAAATGEIRGFVFTNWAYEIPYDDPGECPDGLNVSEREYLSEEFEAVSAEVKRRYEAGDREGALSLLPPDACKDPMVRPDPGHKTFDGAAIVAGIDLDGMHSERDSGDRCAHEDFVGPGGMRGIDNQYWRLMGCVKGFRPGGLFDRLFKTGTAITEGALSTLLEMTLVEGTRDEGRVEVRMFTGARSVTTDANGAIVRHTSQPVHADTMYHSEPFEGEIKDGVLIAGPVDLKLRFAVQAIDNHYWFRDARIRAEMLPDGSVKGVLGGYWDIENLFDFLTEVYLGPIHLGRAAANAGGYMCAGVYHALPRLADGHLDPETGQCTSLSTSIQFAAVPAFIIHPEELAASSL
ncbi:MAG: hypothetical protein JRJ58_05245 [Deltaproteobacteria bacterium]|nr:hypothetical protein [Deltaproteobacteria bacterium]